MTQEIQYIPRMMHTLRALLLYALYDQGPFSATWLEYVQAVLSQSQGRLLQ